VIIGFRTRVSNRGLSGPAPDEAYRRATPF
jgi:hypothetical protein